MKNKEELLQAKTEEEFNAYLLKNYPEYDEIPINEWNQDIYRYYVENILDTTIEALEKMEEEIIEYEDI